jgi:hypothetical protein
LLTRVLPVVLGPGEDLEGAGHVTQVELVLNGNEDLDRLEVERIRFLNDCTWWKERQSAAASGGMSCIALAVWRALTHLWQLVVMWIGM